MAYQSIGRGTSANDGTGDDLRTGAGKVNANFVELYTLLGDGSTLSADPVVTEAATQTLTNKSLTSPTITGTGAIAGTFTGNITGDVTGNVTGNLTGNVSTASGNIQLDAFTQIVEVRGDGSATEGQIVLNCEQNTHGQTIKPQPHSATVTNVLTLPAGGDQELVGTDATQTLTNKTLTSPTITGTGAIAGTFTGNITGDVTGNVTGNVDGIVGGTTPAAGSFTTVSLSDALQLAVFADGTARDAAISAPAAGMLCFVSDNGSAVAKAQVYDGSAWVDLH